MEDTLPRARRPAGAIAVPLSFGTGAAVVLLGLYIVIVGLAQGWMSALQLLGQDAYLVGPITASFGVQVALYTHLRRLVKARTRGAGAITGASGGTSTAAMVACCAHRVADLLPILGLSAVAGFLAAWKVPFMIVGLTFSIGGIILILRRTIQYKKRHMPKEDT
jgi:Cu+-exporting ATPase